MRHPVIHPLTSKELSDISVRKFQDEHPTVAELERRIDELEKMPGRRLGYAK